MKNTKNGKFYSIIFYVRSVLISATCLLGISMFFINSEMFANFTAKGLNLKLNPSLIGGETAAEYFYEGELVQYTIHKPVYEAKWQKYSEYWQLDLLYKEPLSDLNKIAVYIDIDSDGNGSVNALSSEEISFESEHPWDYCVVICGDKGKIYDTDANMVDEVQTAFLENRKKLVVRIPLKDKNLQKAFLYKSSCHYICTCRFENQNVKEFVAQNVSLNATSDFTDGDIESFIKSAKDSIILDFYEDEKTFASTDEKLAYYKNLLEKDSENPLYLAKYGSALATKGGESNAMKAIKLVKEAYTYLDKAAALASGKECEFAVLMERAHVSYSVPEMVFKKSEAGAKDFVKCAELYKNSIKGKPDIKDKNMLLYLYIMAAECYNNCNKNTQAKLMCIEAKKYMM
ncbi:MAG: hypothetical protein IK002_03445 [Treponema sp.]|uniref:hypothetical protein n=1 Tax=Treponema sp. TaxID=166 RepID=UPI00298DE5EB|nr:hypothetical protein [Treponema sp.]MBR5933022.1 hypothetical protein [Treponema sp.]